MLGFEVRNNSLIINKGKAVKLTHLLIAGTVATSLFSTGLMADNASQAASNLSDTQKKEVEKLVHDYLVSNPEVLWRHHKPCNKNNSKICNSRHRQQFRERRAIISR